MSRPTNIPWKGLTARNRPFVGRSSLWAHGMATQATSRPGDGPFVDRLSHWTHIGEGRARFRPAGLSRAHRSGPPYLPESRRCISRGGVPSLMHRRASAGRMPMLARPPRSATRPAQRHTVVDDTTWPWRPVDSATCPSFPKSRPSPASCVRSCSARPSPDSRPIGPRPSSTPTRRHSPRAWSGAPSRRSAGAPSGWCWSCRAAWCSRSR